MNLANNLGSIPESSWDVVVIGAGAAGLMTSIELSNKFNVLLLNRNTSKRSSSRWAQGGIAAVTRINDSDDSHAEDTFNAGAGLCDADAVRMFVQNAPQCVDRLMSLGMEFDNENGVLSTTLEAAHSHRRVLHVQDRTGRALVEVLQDQVEQRENISHLRGIRVTQLWVENNMCLGVQVLDGSILKWIPSRAVVIATGGGGHLFANTTNPAQACGEGIALAWNAGAAIKDLEFVQFHPTALKLDGAPCFLLSEALRGEGALLTDKYGQSPVSKLLGKDLAPRDQVSRALFQAMRSQGVNHLGLDLRTIGRVKATNRFPTILQRCRDFGLDPFSQIIPIAPAAHYWMGGISTNLSAETDMPGLYAVGEVACTGLHGANRLASNSLMECLVFAMQFSSCELAGFRERFNKNRIIKIDKIDFRKNSTFNSKDLIFEIEKLRNLLWRVAGVDRSPQGIKNAISSIRKDFDLIKREPLLEFILNHKYDMHYELDEDQRRDINLLLDLYHRQITSLLMLEACYFRRESRGGHYRSDTPSTMPHWRCHSRQKLGYNISTRPVNI
ncbi:L-aspartate oxidase [Prochlorococcus sp. MIT 1223]|uniref:L-aspartate oxidase n=1 Tax=Prochlorococcus sp. MIT 1223 TaxID=3096217 RepID=UPI002A74E4C4|nr:L-aspartate oxidase [Prochlorococcus sp. MIT 1223]